MSDSNRQVFAMLKLLGVGARWESAKNDRNKSDGDTTEYIRMRY